MKPLEAGDPTSVGQGRYRLVGRLGQGGMGVVYFGRSQSGRAVAVKVVRPELSTEPGFRRRFADEVAAARRVGGFHTAPVVDADPDGEPAWLVTAFVPGPTLQAVLQTVGALPLDTVSVLAAGLAEALEAIHRVGVMHRDLKPANIIVAEDGPRVIDFGIARALDGTALTQTGLQIGTPGYLAPEQLTGGAVTPAVDMFALGVVLSQATGAFPFGDGPSAARHYRVVHEEPDLAGVPERLRPLIGACLAKDPADRPTPARFLARLTVRDLPDGAWLPEAATAMLRRVEPPPATAAGAEPAAGWAESPFTPPPAAGPSGAAAAPPATDHPDTVKAGPPGPTHSQAPDTPPGSADPRPQADPFTGDHPRTVRAEAPLPPAPSAAPPAYPATPATAPAGGGFGPPAAPSGAAAGPRRAGGRRRTALIAVAALVVAGSAAGLLATQPWSGGHHHNGTSSGGNAAHSASTGASGSAKAAGPAPLSTGPLLVRETIAGKTPGHCGQVIGVRDPDSDVLRQLTSGDDCDRLPAWAPDHKSFAFVRGSGADLAVWIEKTDGTGHVDNTGGSGPRKLAAISGGRVSWSPDGSRLALLRKADNGVQQLYVLTLADGSARQITSGARLVDDPAWSPDGSKIAVCVETSPGLSQIHLVDPDDPGAAPRQITHQRQKAKDPAWSPDGKHFAYTFAGGSTQGDIHLIAVDGTGDRPLAATGDLEMDPTWSPDGQWVAYVRGPVDAPAVWAVRADGTGARKLTTGDVPEGHPSWR
ncbi:protein kinase domain-containing protein [Streptomyces sp. NBC_01190]|uniref:protein kinase domain-containing protein n=1 Tax=Streptomyces sp. NBC_01190 TaxID=2903767 RepID=UPI003869FE34|nr:serine/threonine-protein kinase [Streptomyces sp. NBC_01190]